MSRHSDFVDDVFRTYVKCALWASTFVDDDHHTVPMVSRYGPDDIATESRLAMRQDVEHFVDANLDDIATMPSYEAGHLTGCALRVGHDLWLTRNHHGAGFWDRGLGELGQRLTEAAHAMGESDLYVGDDGQVHAS